jgi:putative membrane protein
MSLPTSVAYCGAPPHPADLAGRWNFDPLLIAVMTAGLAIYLITARRGGVSSTRTASFCAGWLVALIAMISPLCALSVALFSARIVQHMVLSLVAAPLLAIGFEPFGPKRERRSDIAPALAFLILLWLWHAPAPYVATFTSPVIYWAMHISLVGSAIWLWCELLNGAPTTSRLAAAALSMIQMGFLGAVLTLAPRPLYAPHLLTTAAWGLTPLQDQQLGGALMWAPGGLVFLVAALIIARRWLSAHPVPVLQAAE